MFLFKHVPSFTGMQKMASACKHVIHFDATLLGALVMEVRVEVTALARAEYVPIHQARVPSFTRMAKMTSTRKHVIHCDAPLVDAWLMGIYVEIAALTRADECVGTGWVQSACLIASPPPLSPSSLIDLLSACSASGTLQ